MEQHLQQPVGSLFLLPTGVLQWWKMNFPCLGLLHMFLQSLSIFTPGFKISVSYPKWTCEIIFRNIICSRSGDNSKPSTHLSVCWIEGHCSCQHKHHTYFYCGGWAQKCFHTDSELKFVEVPTFLTAAFNDGWHYHDANQRSYAQANEKKGQPGNIIIGGRVVALTY